MAALGAGRRPRTLHTFHVSEGYLALAAQHAFPESEWMLACRTEERRGGFHVIPRGLRP